MKNLKFKKLVSLELVLIASVFISLVVALYATITPDMTVPHFWNNFIRCFIITGIPILLGGIVTWLLNEKKTFLMVSFLVALSAIFYMLESLYLFFVNAENEGIGYLLIGMLIFLVFNLFSTIPLVVLLNSENTSLKKADNKKKALMGVNIVVAIVMIIACKRQPTVIVAYFTAILSLFYMLYNDGEKHRILLSFIYLMFLFAIVLAIGFGTMY